MNDEYGPRRRADGRVVSAQERCEQHYANVLGNLIVSRADDVEDMAHRVVDVLGGNPRDHHYAGSKLSYAMTRCAEALAIAGWTEAEIVDAVRDAHRNGAHCAADVRRELTEERQSPAVRTEANR